ncbi:MAG: GtrA family protein [Thermoleophilia bacterium]
MKLIDEHIYFRGRRAVKQFGKYCVVGVSGFAVNLMIYSVLVEHVHLHYLVGATVSFTVAVTNNFVLNKYWTFGNPDGDLMTQVGRFLVVSVTSLILNLLILRLLVEDFDMNNKITAQAIAIIFVTGLNFLGNKLWSFRQTAH